MASLVVGDIRSRTLERQPVGRDVYYLGLWLSRKGRESFHRLCLVQVLLFRVVIFNHIIAALEL
jgi:hypothetical protein